MVLTHQNPSAIDCSISVVFSFLGWGCHSEIATFAYYLTMDGRWFLAIIFFVYGFIGISTFASLQDPDDGKLRREVLCKWLCYVNKYCECLKPESFMALFGIYFNPMNRYHRIPRPSYVRFRTLPYSVNEEGQLDFHPRESCIYWHILYI